MRVNIDCTLILLLLSGTPASRESVQNVRRNECGEMSETITADHLNATHLGKKISILDNCEIVMSGKLKELRATQYSMPVYSNNIEAVPNGYGNITIAPKLNYETVTDIIMHLSNQLNDDIKATVHGDTELVIEVNGK